MGPQSAFPHNVWCHYTPTPQANHRQRTTSRSGDCLRVSYHVQTIRRSTLRSQRWTSQSAPRGLSPGRGLLALERRGNFPRTMAAYRTTVQPMRRERGTTHRQACWGKMLCGSISPCPLPAACSTQHVAAPHYNHRLPPSAAMEAAIGTLPWWCENHVYHVVHGHHGDRCTDEKVKPERLHRPVGASPRSDERGIVCHVVVQATWSRGYVIIRLVLGRDTSRVRRHTIEARSCFRRTMVTSYDSYVVRRHHLV